eukprot:TRINITY_DN30243_c0_g1_i1.p1 TRINITY_DN30243_c0_g1~~TRINITY_DN30243_c0_g1_i1.p1  ORF type:complete len:408 (+),score=52.62 TRINITY_DN30243_c0_g1_i1:26-1249(+)
MIQQSLHQTVCRHRQIFVRHFRNSKMEDTFDKEAFVKSAFSNCSKVKFRNERSMGFTGAVVAEVDCEVPEGLTTHFLKVVDVKPLGPEATEGEQKKRKAHLRSYTNELAFLSDKRLAPSLRENGVGIPVLLASQVLPSGGFATLSECLSENSWLQYSVHPQSRTQEAVSWLAGFHGSFHGKMGSLSGHELWPAGCHVRLELRPASEFESMPKNFAHFCEAFAQTSPFFARPESVMLGTRLAAVAPKVAEHLLPERRKAEAVTLVHGDFKGANFFFQKEASGCTAIDFQWTGPGIGATDLIYFLSTSVEDSVTEKYLDLLHAYHIQLKAPGYSYDEFLRDFKVATLDYVRWAFGRALIAETPEKYRERAEKVDPNLGYFRRSAARVEWLLTLVETFLPEAENGNLFQV